MDSLQMDKYRKQRLLNKFMLYSFTSLTCILFLSSPLWYPLLRAFVTSLLFVSLPKLAALFFSSKCIFLVGNLIVIFLVGESKIFRSQKSPCNVVKQNYAAVEQENVKKNFIFLTGDQSKLSRSRYSYSLPFSVNLTHGQEQEETFCGYDEEEEEKQMGSVILENVMNGLEGNYCIRNCIENEEFGVVEPNELSKRADDFIARVNQQIRLEAVSMI
ncbi:hypothetical protein BC332_08513 [Capsicum chinense]|nr:hypothetical protein BC332_08513 [Capsicum chinense]